MNATIQDTVLFRLNKRISELGHLDLTLALLSEIPLATLKRKLAGEGEFSVSELESLCRVVQLPMWQLFSTIAVREQKPCENEACIAETHEFENGEPLDPCEHHRFRYDGGDGEYFAEVQKHPGNPWVVYGELGFTASGRAGLPVIDAYRRDYLEACVIADRLNGSELHRRTEPGEPDQQGIGGGL